MKKTMKEKKRIGDLFRSFRLIVLSFFLFCLLSFFFSIIYTPDIGAPSSLFTINIECKTNNQIYTQRRENTRKRKRQRGSESKGQSICARAKREIRAIASAHTTT